MTAPDADPPLAVVYADPIPRDVVEEIAQMLGYDPKDVALIVIGGRHVGVTTTAVQNHEVTDTVHKHTVI